MSEADYNAIIARLGGERSIVRPWWPPVEFIDLNGPLLPDAAFGGVEHDDAGNPITYARSEYASGVKAVGAARRCVVLPPEVRGNVGFVEREGTIRFVPPEELGWCMELLKARFPLVAQNPAAWLTDSASFMRRGMSIDDKTPLFSASPPNLVPFFDPPREF